MRSQGRFGEAQHRRDALRHHRAIRNTDPRDCGISSAAQIALEPIFGASDDPPECLCFTPTKWEDRRLDPDFVDEDGVHFESRTCLVCAATKTWPEPKVKS